MVDQFVETWRINNRVNLMLLDEISKEGLHAMALKSGGRTPARQFAYIHNVRLWQLEKLAVDLTDGLEKISSKEDICREFLRYKLIKSSEAIAQLLREGFLNDGKLEGYRRGVIAFQCYLIAHESHYRGYIMHTLKQRDYKLPKSLTYGIWDWNKI